MADKRRKGMAGQDSSESVADEQGSAGVKVADSVVVQDVGVDGAVLEIEQAAYYKSSLPRLAVAMCVWRRIERLPATLAKLAAQTDMDFDLHLINNDPALREQVEKLARGFPVQVTVTHQAVNRGSYSRILYAHAYTNDSAHANRPYAHWCFIDDDMEFPVDYIAQVKQQAELVGDKALVGWRAWKFGRIYWDKLPVKIGEPASFVIGCGMVVPTAVLASSLVEGLAEARWNCDDLWLSYVANHLMGYKLYRGDFKGCDVVEDGKDTYRALHQEKINFLNECRATGWRV